MDEILHHFETMGNRCLVVFTRESSFQSFLRGAKWISQPSVGLLQHPQPAPGARPGRPRLGPRGPAAPNAAAGAGTPGPRSRSRGAAAEASPGRPAFFASSRSAALGCSVTLGKKREALTRKKKKREPLFGAWAIFSGKKPPNRKRKKGDTEQLRLNTQAMVIPMFIGPRGFFFQGGFSLLA